MTPDIGRLATLAINEVRSWPWEVTVAMLVILAFGASFAGIMAYSTRIELLRPLFAVIAALCATAFTAVVFCIGFDLIRVALSWLHGVLASLGAWIARAGVRL